MWKRQVPSPEPSPTQVIPESLLSQLRAIEARLVVLETAREHPATVARLDAMEQRVENVLMDWANVKQKIARMFGRLVKQTALDTPEPAEGVQTGPQNADDVLKLARQRGAIP